MLSAYLDRWLSGTVKGSVKPSTYESYERIVRVHFKPGLGKRKLKTLAPDHVQYLYQAKLDAGLAPGTVRLMHAVLNRALDQAVKWGSSRGTSARLRRRRNRTRKRSSPLTPSAPSAY